MPLSQRLRTISRLAFFLLWIPFITLFIGMAGMPNGSYDFAELPLLARVSLIGMGLFGGAAIILLLASFGLGSLSNRAVLARGLPAEAAILEIADTGTTINNDPLVRLTLEVRPPGGPPFQAHTERVIPRLQIPQIQPGAIVHVMYDPASKAVALQPGAGA